MKHHNYTASDILKTNGILLMTADASLDAALRKCTSSHDVIMVVDDEEKLLGVVSPYYARIRHTHPPGTKLKNVLMHAPHVTKATRLTEVVRLIVESKLHNLPVVDDAKRILGIVTARRVLQRLVDIPSSGEGSEVLNVGKQYLQTVNTGSSMNEAMEFFKRTKYSKLVIVDEHNHLKGILSVYDTLGKETKGKLVDDFMKKHVVTVRQTATVATIIATMLEKEIGSVVIVKPGNIPVQIITTSDILNWSIE